MDETRTPEEMAEVDRRRAERFAERDVRALLSVENFDVIAQRVERMFPVGQRFAMVQEYLGSHGGSAEITASTRRDVRSRGEGLRITRQESPRWRSLSVSTEQAIMGFGMSTGWAHEREIHAELARLHDYATEHGFPYKPEGKHYDRTGVGSRTWQGVTYVDLVGGLEGAYRGHGDHLTIIYTNENGVSRRTIVIPEYLPPDQRAGQEQAVLDRAADYIDSPDAPQYVESAAADLRDIGARNIWHGKTLAEWCGPVDDQARRDAAEQRKWAAREAGR